MSKVTILIVAALTVVVAAFLPAFIRARTTPAMNYCVNNLRQLDGAKQQWALENRRITGDSVTWDDVKPYLKMPIVCSRGGTYILGRVGELPRCSNGRGTHIAAGRATIMTPNPITSLDAGMTPCLHSGDHWPGASEFNR